MVDKANSATTRDKISKLTSFFTLNLLDHCSILEAGEDMGVFQINVEVR